jgi:hypothetical protein
MSCPVCEREVPISARYPSYVCDECVELVRTAYGEKVHYINQSFGFGVQGILETGTIIYDTICFIHNKRYRVLEARFGGIIIVPYLEESLDTHLGSAVG